MEIITSSWKIENGKLWESCVTTAETKSCPELEDLIDYDKTVVLQRPENDPDSFCLITLECRPLQEFQCIEIVCDCPKIEILRRKEYQKTVYGNLEDDFEDVKIYRYEITSNLCESVSLRLLTKESKITILGLFLGIKMTTNLPQSVRSINLQNVQDILGNTKLSPSAEKCKDFLQMFMKTGGSAESLPLGFMTGMQGMNLNGNGQCNPLLNGSVLDKTVITEPTDSKNNELKFYVDLKFREMEQKFAKRLNDLERSQNAKLDKILELLGRSAIKDSDS